MRRLLVANVMSKHGSVAQDGCRWVSPFRTGFPDRLLFYQAADSGDGKVEQLNAAGNGDIV